MKKKFLIILTICAISAISLIGCKSSDNWKTIDGLYILEEYHVVDYYVSYIKSRTPLVEIEEKVLEEYRTEYPEEFAKMIKPIPVMIQEKSENVILFSDEDGNIYITGSEAPIGKLT